MKRTLMGILPIVCLLLFTTTAFAFGWGDVKTYISGTALAAIITFVLGLGVIAIYTDWVAQLFISVGTLFTLIGASWLNDKKFSKEEIADIKEKAKLVRQTIKNKPKK